MTFAYHSVSDDDSGCLSCGVPLQPGSLDGYCPRCRPQGQPAPLSLLRDAALSQVDAYERAMETPFRTAQVREMWRRMGKPETLQQALDNLQRLLDKS